MMPRHFILPFFIILTLSCESQLYPPTDPPELSDLVLTSSSYNYATTSAIQGDTVFMSIAVDDPEDDPEFLTLSITLNGTEVRSEEFGESRIHDETSWEGWFETSDLAVGSYVLNFTATDKEGNEGDTLSQSFEIETSYKESVMAEDITVTLTVNNISWLAAGEDSDPLDDIDESDEPFRVLFDVTNNSSITIDLANIKLNIEDVTDVIIDEDIAVVVSLEAGETYSDQQLRFNILDESAVDEVLYVSAESSVVVY